MATETGKRRTGDIKRKKVWQAKHMSVWVGVHIHVYRQYSLMLSHCLPGRQTDRWEDRMRQVKSQTKNLKKGFFSRFFVFAQMSGLWQSGRPASSFCLSIPPRFCARAAAVDAMLGRVPRAPSGRRGPSLAALPGFEGRPVTLVRVPEYGVKVPHQDSLMVVLLLEGCTNWTLGHGGDPWEGTMDSYRISSYHPLASPSPSILHPFSLDPSFTSSKHLSWLPASSLPQSHSFLFYPSMHPSFLSSLPQLNAIIVMDFSPSVDGFRHPVLKWG